MVSIDRVFEVGVLFFEFEILLFDGSEIFFGEAEILLELGIFLAEIAEFEDDSFVLEIFLCELLRETFNGWNAFVESLQVHAVHRFDFRFQRLLVGSFFSCELLETLFHEIQHGFPYSFQESSSFGNGHSYLPNQFGHARTAYELQVFKIVKEIEGFTRIDSGEHFLKP